MNESLIDSFLRCTPPLKWVSWSQDLNLDDTARRALQSVLFDDDDQLRIFTEENRREVARCLVHNQSLRLFVEQELGAFMESIAIEVENLDAERRMTPEKDVRELHFIVGRKAARRRMRELSGYIHDARLKVADIRIEDDWARIPVQRDCWEYGFDRVDGSLELFVANSLISVYPAASLRFHSRCEFKTEPWISKACLRLSVDESSVSAHFTCTGSSPNAWRLVAEIADPSRLVVLLADQERPYLWSKRYGAKK